MDLEKDAFRYAIKNAFLHNGKADAGAVIGKLKALDKNIDLKTAVPKIIEQVKKVNSMEFGEIEKEYDFFKDGYELKPKEKAQGLPELEWAKKEKVVTRFAPNPNGPFHLGNARAAILSQEYAKKYGGKFFLRFDDTDPKVKKPIENAKEIYLEDLNWLECPPDKIFFASDRLTIYHNFMKKAIEKGKAYVCTCESEKWKSLVTKKTACPCREKKPAEQMELFEKMLSNKLKEGSAVLRIKTNLDHADPSVRDWWAAKIVDVPVHPNKKTSSVHVWPSYNFSSAIDDHELGVTLIIRGQEHEQNKTKQEFLYKYFGWTYPHAIHFGRIKLGKTILSTSKIKEGIEKGIYTGWDDPRLGTIRALRRRGFEAQALKTAILDLGIKPSDASIEFARLADLNQTAVQKKAVQAEFLTEVVQFDVQFAPKTSANGFELKEGSQSFLVPKKEIDALKENEVFRLKKAYNVRLVEKGELQARAEFVGLQKIDKKIVAWILNGLDVVVLMDDGKKILGITENRKFKEGEIVYFERFGFVKVETVSPKRIECVFAHK